jgi:predicted double-glycine peptidase
MMWFFLILNIIILGLAAVLGWRSGRFGRRGFYATLLAGAALLLVRSFLHLRPELEQHLLALSPDYIYFAGWGGPISILMVFALAVRLPRWRMRRLAATLLLLMMPVFMWSNLMVYTIPDYNMPARFDEDGVCRQTTDYSCGPAAALTMLKPLGRELSEGEMARLSLLRPNQGVTLLELSRGINLALGDGQYRATIERRRLEDLASERMPFLAEIRRAGTAEHCVAVLAVADDVLILGDPAYGKRLISRREFESQWSGLIIAVRTTVPTGLTHLPLGASLP